MRSPTLVVATSALSQNAAHSAPLQTLLASLPGYAGLDNPGGGNCGPHAIGRAIECAHDVLRALVVSIAECASALDRRVDSPSSPGAPTTLADFVVSSLATWVDTPAALEFQGRPPTVAIWAVLMSRDGTFFDDAALLISAMVLNYEIVVHPVDSRCRILPPVVFAPTVDPCGVIALGCELDTHFITFACTRNDAPAPLAKAHLTSFVPPNESTRREVTEALQRSQPLATAVRRSQARRTSPASATRMSSLDAIFAWYAQWGTDESQRANICTPGTGGAVLLAEAPRHDLLNESERAAVSMPGADDDETLLDKARECSMLDENARVERQQAAAVLLASALKQSVLDNSACEAQQLEHAVEQSILAASAHEEQLLSGEALFGATIERSVLDETNRIARQHAAAAELAAAVEQSVLDAHAQEQPPDALEHSVLNNSACEAQQLKHAVEQSVLAASAHEEQLLSGEALLGEAIERSVLDETNRIARQDAAAAQLAAAVEQSVLDARAQEQQPDNEDVERATTDTRAHAASVRYHDEQKDNTSQRSLLDSELDEVVELMILDGDVPAAPALIGAHSMPIDGAHGMPTAAEACADATNNRARDGVLPPGKRVRFSDAPEVCEYVVETTSDSAVCGDREILLSEACLDKPKSIAELRSIELSSFEWPLRSVSDVKRLLACSFAAPTDIVGFEFSAAMRSALEAEGRVALSVDLRESDKGGMHACLDVRLVLPLRTWERAYLFPPCFQQLRADKECLSFKIFDGRAFWGCLMVIYCLCADADLLVVEQPDTIVADYYDYEYIELRTSAFGDKMSKFARLAVRNLTIELPAGHSLAQNPSSAPLPVSAYANPEERDRKKSTWAGLPKLCAYLASREPLEQSSPRLSFSKAALEFANAWHFAGFPVPLGYMDPQAMPPSADIIAYQTVRGPGDGRLVQAVIPASLDYSEATEYHERLCDYSSPDSSPSSSRSTSPPPPVRGGGSTAPTGLEVDGAVPTLDIRAAGEACVVLVLISVLMQPVIFAHVNGFTVLGAAMPALSSRTACLELAQCWVDRATDAIHYAYLVGEYLKNARLAVAPLDFAPPPHEVCRTPKARLGLLAAGATFWWCTLAALAGTAVGDAAARSIIAAAAFVRPIKQLADFAAAGSHAAVSFHFGSAPATSVVRRPNLDNEMGPPGWRALSADVTGGRQLFDALRAASDDALLAGWSDVIRPFDATEIPSELLANLRDFADDRLDNLQLSPVYKPLETAWVPLPPKQPPPPSGGPMCISSPLEMLNPSAKAQLDAWLAATLNDLVLIRNALFAGVDPDDIDRQRPRPLAIGQGALFEWARGIVWDCREQCCKPLDFQVPIETHLNLDYLRQRLTDYPDQYLVSNLLEGVRLDADVELHTVLVPHLTSLPKGFASVEKELRRLHNLGWYDFFSIFPFWPMYLNGQGATARKLEPDRFRRTTEGGGPRHEIYDEQGIRALSINEASRVPHMPAHFSSDLRPEFVAWLAARGLPRDLAAEPLGSRPNEQDTSKYPKETKPTLAQIMRDLAILKHAADVLEVPIYVFGDDAKDYFNQLAISNCDLPKLGIVFLAHSDDHLFGDDATDRLLFVSERRLGFGTHGASNVAQRVSEALLFMFRQDMDEVDEIPIEWRRRRQLVQQESETPCFESRGKSVCPQERLYSIHMYTDDPIMIVVGVERTLLALRVWRRLTDNVGLLMAIPEKRSLGTWCKWLGVIIIASLGLVIIPKDKLVRASRVIDRVLADGAEFHTYRSLCGLLEFLRAVNLSGRNVMHGLYRPHGPKGASRFGPSGWVTCDVLMTKQLLRWRTLLARSAGVSVKSILERHELEAAPTLLLTIYGDACFGDSDPSGLGGFCQGVYWHFLVPKCDYDVLSIPILEFLAACFNILTFSSQLSGLLTAEGTHVVLCTDALTTALTLPRETQRSEGLVEAFQRLRVQQEWELLAPKLQVAHVFGDCNPFSDMISRSRWQSFRRLCAQHALRPHRVALPPACMELYDNVLTALRSRRAPLRAGGRSLGDGHSGMLATLIDNWSAVAVQWDPGCPACQEGRTIIMCIHHLPQCAAFECAMECGRAQRCTCMALPPSSVLPVPPCRDGSSPYLLAPFTRFDTCLPLLNYQHLLEIPAGILSMTEGRRAPQLRLRYATASPASRLYSLCRLGQLRDMPGLDLYFSDELNVEHTLETDDRCLGGLLVRPMAGRDGTAYILASYTHPGCRRLGVQRLMVAFASCVIQPRRLVRQANNTYGQQRITVNERLGFAATPSATAFVLSLEGRRVQHPMLMNAPSASDRGTCIAMEKRLLPATPLSPIQNDHASSPSSCAAKGCPSSDAGEHEQRYCPVCCGMSCRVCGLAIFGSSPGGTTVPPCICESYSPNADEIGAALLQRVPLRAGGQRVLSRLLGGSKQTVPPPTGSAVATGMAAPRLLARLLGPTRAEASNAPAAIAHRTTPYHLPAVRSMTIGRLTAPSMPDRNRSSALSLASRHYAQARAVSLASGGEPSMQLATSLEAITKTLIAVEETTDFGVNANTAKMDERAWAMWEVVCERLGTSPLRTHSDVRDYPQRNTHLLAVLLLHAFTTCTPRDPHRAFVKPRSALAYPLAIIRIFARWGIKMPSYKALVAEVNGLMRLYLAYHGPHSLAPRRAEPMSWATVEKINAIPLNGHKIGGYSWRDDNRRVFIVRRLTRFLWRTAFRIGEVAKHRSGEIYFLTRGSLAWRIGGTIFTKDRPPTRAQLLAMVIGVDGVAVTPPRSKPDEWGEIHCPFTIFLVLTDDPNGACAALRDIELEVPCEASARDAFPLFPDYDGQPLTHGVLDPMLKAIMTHLYGTAVAALFTWHSFRSGLASALHAAGVPDAVIMLMCRWMSERSLTVYRRLGSTENERHFFRATQATVDAIQAPNVVTVVGDQGYAELLSDINRHRGRDDTQHAFAAARQEAHTAAPRASNTSATSPPPPSTPATMPEANTRPLTSLTALGRRVRVARSLWPRDPCTEHGGSGWEAVVTQATQSTAVVRFSFARTRDGRPYQNERVPLTCLTPL